MNYEYRTKVFLGLVGEKPKDGMPTDKQLETLIKFYNFRCGKSNKTIYEDIRELRLLALHTRKAFEKMNAIDLQRYVSSREIAQSYRNTVKKILLTFFKYVHNSPDEKPDCVKWIKFENCQTDITSDDVLTIDEVNAMIGKAKSQRDRTLIALFYDSGCRSGELIENSKLGDVKDDNRGFYIRVTGKTNPEGKSRKVRLKDSIPYLIEYLANHPTRNPDDPLFMTNYNGGLKRMSKEQASTIIKKAANDAGIKKNVHPHLLRHTRTSHVAPRFSDQTLKAHLGWKKSSRMPERYVHTSESIVDDSVCKGLDIEIPKEEVTPLELQTIKCNICDFVNPASNYLCYKCKRMLRADITTPFEEEENARKEYENELRMLEFEKKLELQTCHIEISQKKEVIADLKRKISSFKRFCERNPPDVHIYLVEIENANQGIRGLEGEIRKIQEFDIKPIEEKYNEKIESSRAKYKSVLQF